MKSQIFIFLGLFLTGAAFLIDLEQPPVEPIVGGQDADKDEYPWLVLLYYGASWACGGSIINERTILTAAHCVDWDPHQNYDSFWAVAGDWDRSVDEGTEQTRTVAEVRMHRRYNIRTVNNDIALLILDSPLTYTGSVMPVPMLSDKIFDEEAVTSSGCVVSGWGIQDQDPVTVFPDIMQELVPVDVVTNKDCKKSRRLAGAFRVGRSEICTLENNAGFCSGDSGGAMGCFDASGVFHQVGIVSWGSTDCSNGFNVYTRVSSYLDWITANQA